jgi:hypothetical protein
MKRLTPAWLLAGLILAGGNAARAQAGGQHDFDFWVGTWKCQCRRLVRPLRGSTEWKQFSASNVTRPLLDGKGWLDEYQADRPTGRVQGVTLGLFDGKSGQWSLYWWNPATGPMGAPIRGQFKEGRGEFYQEDSFEGKKIRVRNLWLNPKPGVVRWEQAFSADSGKTWETNAISDWVRDN